MRILKGFVSDIQDVYQSGKFRVNFDKNNNDSHEVYYTTPFFSRWEFGLVAIPAIGSQVLVYYDDDTAGSKNYYYLCTVFDAPIYLGVLDKFSPLLKEKSFYTEDGYPKAIIFKDHKGAGLKISNYSSEKKKNNSSRVSLNSVQGHKLVLSDDPKRDCVILKNKDGDGITITANRSRFAGDNTIVIKSRSSQNCVVDNGEYVIRVNDGRDITIQNDSVGTNRPYVIPTNPLDPRSPLGNPLQQYGNINLISRWKDINIYTGADNLVNGIGGSIYISTLNGVVQINSIGEVKIFSVSSISLQAVGDLNLMSITGDVNIQGQNINMNSISNTNIAAANSFNAQGITETNLGSGSPLNLNKVGGAIPAGTLPDMVMVPELPTLNAYGR